ncbi:superinfection immunity protein [Rhodovibrio salinarum]|uniref:Superinfection immunity protein n=1 Tax=Rhodovibrio salinarum TaxID=1087 RepID=A0A934QH55_9PROT|nr:superinfection immunity protein [Rhodovibrio salinarum]MBK1696435.1 superinfection immunity protein [Rhodovibrio salinarum]
MDLGGWTLLVLVVLYFVPLTLAVWRGHPKAMAILAINIAFGWTVVGWVIALVWSMTGPNYRYAPKTQYQQNDGEHPGA